MVSDMASRLDALERQMLDVMARLDALEALARDEQESERAG